MNEEGKYGKARRAALLSASALYAKATFNIQTAGEEHLMETSAVPPTFGQKTRRDFVNKLTAAGGTNINDSLVAALKQSTPRRAEMLVL